MFKTIAPNAGPFLSLIFCLILAAPASMAAASDGPVCEGLAKASAEARAAKDLGKLETLLSQEKASDALCSERTIFCLGRNVALGYLDQAYARADAGAPPEELDKLLIKGKSFGAPWQLSVMEGDLRLHRAQKAHDGAQYSEASAAYQRALIELQDEQACHEFGEPPRPSAEDTEHIYRNMTATLLLAAPLKIERTRCSPCSWAFFSRIGGFEPHSRPLPLTFREGQTDLTPEGSAAAKELGECLKVEKPSRIVLSGHADPTGSDVYNADLSARRLAAVKDLLVKGGFAGEVQLEPKGKTEPFALPDASGYSPEEIRKLDRRIELVSYADAAAGCVAAPQP
jgi:OOP family OmpA-OmpF porin